MGTKNLVIHDLHIDDKGYDPVYAPVRKLIKKEQFDSIILAGDIGDCCSLSHWALQKRRAMEGKRHLLEIDHLKRELDFWQENSKKVVYLEGNHENWCEQYLDKNPELEGLIEYPLLLDLKGRDIKWVPQNKLYKLGHLYVTHGLYTNEHHAKKHLYKFGCNILYGHTHRSQTHTNNMLMQKTHKAWGGACLCDKAPAFMKGTEGSWDQGCEVVYVADNGEFNLYMIDIIKNRFYFNGKSYSV